MRFQLGEEIYGVAFINVNEKFSTLAPLMQKGAQLEKIFFTKLTVAEHHLVNWAYDPKDKTPENDGYVLLDENNLVFHNQYPMAQFEQTSDKANWIFTAAAIPSDKVEDLLLSRNSFPYCYESLTRHLDSLLDFIDSTSSSQFHSEHYLAKMLQTAHSLRDRILTDFHSQYPGKEIVLEKVTIEGLAFNNAKVVDR